ncbi:TCR/Tet family MFS transporter [Ferruginibacter sp. SUN106]|uniref:TCR/Tet family MFS transporter n=1 Tax=Ferruginibacter sp. SUN106 TaxID=2978348 RepID=UPI003D363770
MATKGKAAIGFIFITLLIDVIGFGIIIPVMPGLISKLKGVSVSAAATYGMWLTVAYSFMQLIFSPIIGNLSDKYGRRPVLLFSLFGFGIDYLFLALAPSYSWLFIGRIIAGITGASFTTASAYIADVSTPENRAKNFGMIGAAFGLGFIIGPLLGGVISHFGERMPFYAAASLALLNWAYGYFVLPESLSKENRREFNWKKANPVSSLKKLKKFPSIGGLIISMLLLYIAAHAVMSNWSYFTIERFKWTELMVGISLTVVGVLVGLVQAGLTRIINPKLGNEKSIYLGLTLYALGMILFGLANQSWMMFVFLVPYCLGGLAQPALQATMAGKVPPNEQGELQGALTSVMSLASIVGPFIMNGLFSFFTKKGAPIYLPGAPFFLGCILMTAAAVVAFKTLHPGKTIQPV